MSRLTISGSSAPGSLVKYAVMASAPSPRIGVCHLSADVKLFASNFKTSGDSFDFKRCMETKDKRYWPLSVTSCASGSSNRRVSSLAQLETPSESSRLNISHDLPHSSSLHPSWITSSIIRPHQSARLCQASYSMVIFSTSRKRISGIKSLNLKQQAHGHLRLSSFMDEIQIMRSFTPLLGSSGGPSELTSNRVLYYESVSISDRFVSQTLSYIISDRTARLNELVHSLMRQHHPHLLAMFFRSTSGQDSGDGIQAQHHGVHGQTLILHRGIDHLTSFGRSWSDGITIIANWFSIRLWSVIIFKPHGQSSCDQLQVISISLNISSCGAQQSRAHSHHSLTFTTGQVLKNQLRHWSACIVIKYGSENRQHHNSASVQLMIRLISSAIMLSVKRGLIVRSLDRCSQGNVSRINCHGLTRLKSKGFNVTGLIAPSELRSLSHRHRIISQN